MLAIGDHGNRTALPTVEPRRAGGYPPSLTDVLHGRPETAMLASPSRTACRGNARRRHESRHGLARIPHGVLSVALALVATAPMASADTLTVSAGESIQAVLDVAQAGDVVNVSAGVYSGLLVINGDGISLVGKGKVILDMYVPVTESGPEGATDGIVIQSSNVSLRNLTIRHAAGSAVVSSGASLQGLVLDKLTIYNATDTAIDLDAQSVTVTRCVIRGNRDGGVKVTGDNALITRNTVRQGAGDAVAVVGDAAEVSRNKISLINNDNGVDILGDGCLVSRNSFTGVDDSAISLTGDNVIADRNTIAGGCEDSALLIFGMNPTVTSNKLSDVLNGQTSIRVVSTGAGGLIDRNTIRNGNGAGIDMNGDLVTVSRNKLQDTGVNRNALVIAGNLNTISQNQVKGAHRDGLRLDGNGNLLQANRFLNGFEDGVFVRSGDSNLLDGNTIRGHQSEGVENGGTNTVLRFNKISKNRIDVVNDTTGGATIDIEDNNSIADGSNGSTEPEV
jgi:hypothetical protein